MDHIVNYVRDKQIEPAIDNYKLNGFIIHEPSNYTPAYRFVLKW